MRVLFINSNRFHVPWPVIPVGLCKVMAAVEAQGHRALMLDLCFEPKPAQAIGAAIAEFKPECIGIGIRNIDIGSGNKRGFLLDAVRSEVVRPCQHHFDGPLVIGGAAVGIAAPEMLEFLDLELAIVGDGETPMCELLHALEAGNSLNDVPGLTRRQDGLTHEPAPHREAELDALPWSRVHRYIDLSAYQPYRSPLQVQTKRGCALECIYCTYNKIEGGTWRLRDPQLVADEIEELVQATGIRHIEITDSAFNLPLRHCKEVLRAIIARGLELRLHTLGLNPGAVDEELVELMREAGFTDVDLGVEACSDTALEGLGKNFRVKHVRRAAALLHSRHIRIHWFLLLGSPKETMQSIKETFDTVDSLAGPWDLVDLGIGIRAYKGAPVAELMQQADPEVSADNFLTPVAYAPPGIDIGTIKLLARHRALDRPNYYMFEDSPDVPRWVFRALDTVAPNKPLWSIMIFQRRLMRKIGLAWLKRTFFEWRHGGHLRALGWIVEPS